VKKELLILILINTLVFGNEDLLDNLLGEFAQNSDLSQETKIKNQGHSIIYTRSDLDRMQARNLRDIMKSIPFFTLQESDANFPNFNMIDQKIPFSGSQLRIYIDNHEMTSGIYGSMFAYMGSIELEFIDHIELYLAMPSFEYSSESTQVLIKLHTKVPKRDDGGKVLISQGTYGGNQQSIYLAKALDKFSYFAYISRLDDKKDNPISYGTEVNRDKQTNHFVGTVFNDKHHLLVNALNIKQGLSKNLSIDATSLENESRYNNIQVSYQNNSIDNIVAKVSYQQADDKVISNDDKPFYFDFQANTTINDIYFNVIDKVSTIQVDYVDKIKNNDILLGATMRNKTANYKTYQTNAYQVSTNGYDTQNVYAFYLQNEFNINNNSIFVLSGKYSKIENNGNINDQTLKMFRAGYTYNVEDFNAKLFYYDNPTPIEPYLYSQFFNLSQSLMAEEMKSVVAEIEYNKNNHNLRLVASQCKTENLFYFNTKYMPIPISPYYTFYVSSLDNYNKIVKNKRFTLAHTYDFTPLNRIKTNYFTQSISNSPNGNYTEQGGYLRFLNTLGKFDVFNEVVYRETSLDGKSWFDYSAGVKYRQSKNLSFSIKGENILDRGLKQDIKRFQTSDYVIYNELPSLQFTPIDKRFYGAVEYSF